jgi:hypothetical protein
MPKFWSHAARTAPAEANGRGQFRMSLRFVRIATALGALAALAAVTGAPGKFH